MLCDMSSKTIKIIAFYGPEGVGKTTHIRLLVPYLREKGCKIREISIRTDHFIIYLLKKLFSKTSYCEFRKLPLGYKVKVPLAPVIRRCKNLWFLLQFVSTLIVYTVKVLPFLLLNYVIVADRFLWHFYADSLYFFKVVTSTKKILYIARMLLDFVLALQFKNSATIILDAEYDELLRRYLNRKSVPEERKYVNFMRVLGRCLFRAYKGKVPLMYLSTQNSSVYKNYKKIIKFISRLSL